MVKMDSEAQLMEIREAVVRRKHSSFIHSTTG